MDFGDPGTAHQRYLDMMARKYAALGPRVSLDQARDIETLCDSYTRLPALIDLFWRMDYQEWLTVIGEAWGVCDTIGEHLSALRRMLPLVGPVRAMMDAKEQAAWDALPPRPVVYRGQRRPSLGISWSLDRALAARFPFFARYDDGGDPILVTAEVQKHNILALKMDRAESEVIVLRGRRILSREPLQPPESEPANGDAS